MEEAGIVSFKSRDWRSVHERDVLEHGLGTGYAARLAEEHVAGIHQFGDPVGESRGQEAPVVSEFFQETCLLHFIAPANADHPVVWLDSLQEG